MGLRMRKSIKICKGVRVNFGKSGTSLSFGTRGLRQTIHSSGRRTTSIGIPGTGISYVTSSGGRRKTTSPSRTSSQQKLGERQENARKVDEYNKMIEMLKGIHKQCDEFVDWKHINSLKEPFPPGGIGPKEAGALLELQNYRPGFFARIIKSLGEKKQEKLKAAVQASRMKDREDYEEWKSLNHLSGRILEGDLDAYLQVINEMNPLDDLLEFGCDFEFGVEEPRSIEVEYKVKSQSLIPDYSLSLTQTGKLSRKNLTKTAYYELVQDYVCSCAIRIARDMFALLPVENVVVHAVDEVTSTETGNREEITILSVLFNREVLNSLNFQHIDPSDAMNNFTCNMKFLKTAGFKPVDRVSDY